MKRIAAVFAIIMFSAMTVWADNWVVSQKRARKIMFGSGYPDNADLIEVVRGAELPADAETAWNILISRSWTPGNYAYMVCSNSQPYRNRAWERLMAEPPNATMLLRVLECADLAQAKELWTRLAQLNVSNSELITFIQSSKGPYQQMAWERLASQKPTFRELRFIYHNHLNNGAIKDSARLMAWMDTVPSDVDLIELVKSANRRYDDGDRAWKILKTRVDRGILMQILMAGCPYSDEAWVELYAIGPTNEEIRRIVGCRDLNRDFRLEVALIGLDRLQ